MKLTAAARARKVELEEAQRVRLYRTMSLRLQRFRCFYCWRPLSPTVATADHLKPRIKGGKTIFDNIKAACRRCNKAKDAIHWADFIASILKPLPIHRDVIRDIALDRWVWGLTWAACERIAALTDVDPVPAVLASYCGDPTCS